MDYRPSLSGIPEESEKTLFIDISSASEEDLTLYTDDIVDHEHCSSNASFDFDIRSIDIQSSWRSKLLSWTTLGKRSSRRRGPAHIPVEDDMMLPNDHPETAVIHRHGSLLSQKAITWLVWPLPSFTHRFFITVIDDEVRRPTDYLDGIRGVASLFVFFDHYISGLFDSFLQHGFADQGHWNLLELPFIKVFYAGGAMVSIFFVISGYVLSQRCVLAMRADNQTKLWDGLTSMSFRRALRLFLPSIAISFLTFLVSILGFLPPPHANWTLAGECHRYWMYLMEDLFKVWDWRLIYGAGWYGRQLWTIPFEFMCSMALFIFILMIARCKIQVRFAVEGFTMTYLLYQKRWDVATFLGGLIIAEIKAARDASQKAVAADGSVHRPRQSHFRVFLIQVPLWTLFIAGYYLAGYPIADAAHTPGYTFLTTLWEGDGEYKRRFWVSIAAFLIIFSAAFLKPLQTLFSTSLARYLGKISYALYLVHGVLNRTVRLWLWASFWNVLQYETKDGDDAKFEGGWALGTIIYFPIVFWCADIFWRAVDIPSVKFAKWVEGKAFKGAKQA